METGLSGRTAVVEGATSGLGLATARSLAAEGVRLLLVGRRRELLEKIAAELPTEAATVAVDLTEPGAVDEVVAAAQRELGDVDIVVLNGGGPPTGSAADLDAAGAEQAIAMLLLPHVRMVGALLPGMRQRGWGRIIAVGSGGVQQPIEGLTTSNVGRGALAGYLKTLAAEVAADGVTVNMVLPGRIDTDRVTSLDESAAQSSGISAEEARNRSESTIPARRYGRPEEFAAVVTFLASAAASYVTGEQVRCDGGMVRSY